MYCGKVNFLKHEFQKTEQIIQDYQEKALDLLQKKDVRLELGNILTCFTKHVVVKDLDLQF